MKFFRALGPVYQPRINRVLRAFIHMRLAKIAQGPDTMDYILNPERIEKRLKLKRPDWGQQAEYISAAERRLVESKLEMAKRAREAAHRALEEVRREKGRGERLRALR